MPRSLTPIAATLAAALVLAAPAALTHAVPRGFSSLIQKKGPTAAEVVETPTLYREAVLPGLPCSAEGFEFFLDRPRTSLALARLADPGLDAYEIEVMPDGSCRVDDGGRLVGVMELVERAPGRRVYYISGYWRFVLGVRFDGRMVLVPTYAETKTDDGPAVDASALGYMKIDNPVIGVVAKLVAYVFPGKVDGRMARFARAVRAVAVMVREDPAGAYGRLSATGRVPEEELAEYRRVFLYDIKKFADMEGDGEGGG